MHPQYYQRSATIAAIATPLGTGAIAIVRISGPDSVPITKKIFSGPVETYRSHTVHTGRILASDGSTIDQVLLIVFRAPLSYTGEDSVEIHCHGSPLIAQRILARIQEAGARLALPGEFTFQAYANGKIDLAQAEAVQLLISSQSELSRKSANQQLEGALSKKIRSFQDELTRIAAILDAWVDFPEEGLEFASTEEIIDQLSVIRSNMKKLLDTFHDGRVIHAGLSLCLLGSPNVGKSSLMNALLGFDRSIVTDIPGTTRDFLEADWRHGDLHFHLIDTAGIRSSQDIIEKEGMKRSFDAMRSADLVFLILDASRALNADDRHLLEIAPRDKTILIWNKIDLSKPPVSVSWDLIVPLSAKNGKGIDDLKQAILDKIWKNHPPSKEEVILSSLRHTQALTAALESCDMVISGLNEKKSPEFIAFDMRSALNHLGEIIGTNVSEDILHSIFSQFCVGK